MLQSLSPEQLDALTERAQRLRGKEPEQPGGNERPLDTVLRVFGADPEALRPAAELILASQAKAWRFGGVVAGENGARGVEYRLRLRRKVPAEALAAQLRDRLGTAAERVELT